MSNGRVAAITGAGSGVEAATARSLAATGANVVLGARRYERLRGVLEATEQRGGGAFAMRCNFTTRSASRSPGASRIGALRGDLASASTMRGHARELRQKSRSRRVGTHGGRQD